MRSTFLCKKSPRQNFSVKDELIKNPRCHLDLQHSYTLYRILSYPRQITHALRRRILSSIGSFGCALSGPFDSLFSTHSQQTGLSVRVSLPLSPHQRFEYQIYMYVSTEKTICQHFIQLKCSHDKALYVICFTQSILFRLVLFRLVLFLVFRLHSLYYRLLLKHRK